MLPAEELLAGSIPVKKMPKRPKALKKTAAPAKTNMEMRAQLRRPMRPMPVTMPKMETQNSNAIVPTTQVLTKGGNSGKLLGRGRKEMVKNASMANTRVSRAARIAMTAAAITEGEAEGFWGISIEVCLYQYHCFKPGDRQVAEEKDKKGT